MLENQMESDKMIEISEADFPGTSGDCCIGKRDIS